MFSIPITALNKPIAKKDCDDDDDDDDVYDDDNGDIYSTSNGKFSLKNIRCKYE